MFKGTITMKPAVVAEYQIQAESHSIYLTENNLQNNTAFVTLNPKFLEIEAFVVPLNFMG